MASLVVLTYVLPLMNKLTIRPDGLALRNGGFLTTVAFRDVDGVFRALEVGGKSDDRRSGVIAGLTSEVRAHVAYDLKSSVAGHRDRVNRHPFRQDSAGTIPLVKGKTVVELAALLNARLESWRETHSAA